MTAEVVDRVLRSSRYRDVDRALLDRLASEEMARSRSIDEATKRVKRRLHQAVGAFRAAGPRDPLAEVRARWNGDLERPEFRTACAAALAAHASTRERVPHLDAFYAGIWAHTGMPRRILDLGCGLAPLSLAWMGVGDAAYLAVDADLRPLTTVRDFLALVGQPNEVRTVDLVADVPTDEVDVALMLKLVTTLDRQDAEAANRLLQGVRARHVVVSLPARSLGGRGKAMRDVYRDRLERLAAQSGRLSAVADASVPNELVLVMTLDG